MLLFSCVDLTMLNIFSHASRIYCPPPDLVDHRNDLVLLIWGDIPYWTVVDDEMYQLLGKMDGRTTLHDVFARYPAWAGHEHSIRQTFETLRRAGVINPRPVRPSAAPFPIENIALNLTNRCNLRCAFCYNLPHLGDNSANELSAEEMIQFLTATRSFQRKGASLTILGGEPFLEPEKLFAVAAHAKSLDMSVIVSTNGTCITDDIAIRVQALGIQVQVSFDGHTPALHDRYRGNGVGRHALAGVETLVRHGVHTVMNMICHQETLPHLEAFLTLAKRCNVAQARFIPLKEIGGAATGGPRPVPLPDLLQAAYTIFQRRPDLRVLLGQDALSILAHTCRYSVRKPSCGTGLQTILLDADGSLYPCLNTLTSAFRVANIRDQGFTFARCWRESSVLRQVRDATSLYRADHPHAACPVRYWCQGGCRGENYSLTGDLSNRPPHCASLRQGIIDLCWMLAEHPDLAPDGTMPC